MRVSLTACCVSLLFIAAHAAAGAIGPDRALLATDHYGHGYPRDHHWNHHHRDYHQPHRDHGYHGHQGDYHGSDHHHADGGHVHQHGMANHYGGVQQQHAPQAAPMGHQHGQHAHDQAIPNQTPNQPIGGHQQGDAHNHGSHQHTTANQLPAIQPPQQPTSAPQQPQMPATKPLHHAGHQHGSLPNGQDQGGKWQGRGTPGRTLLQAPAPDGDTNTQEDSHEDPDSTEGADRKLLQAPAPDSDTNTQEDSQDDADSTEGPDRKLLKADHNGNGRRWGRSYGHHHPAPPVVHHHHHHGRKLML